MTLMQRRDLTGQRFNMLTALSATRASKSGHMHWLFRCDCGVVKELPASRVTRGSSKSCGCSRITLIAKAKTTHGYWKNGVSAPEYSAWCLARNRCHNEGSHAFKDYGARGITMCDRWRFGEKDQTGFECFISDMGDKPSAHYSLDRIDNSKGYSPDNCRWATRSQQQRNTRRTRIVAYRGEQISVAEAVQRAGSVIPYDAVLERLNRGWSVEDAVSIPALTLGNRK